MSRDPFDEFCDKLEKEIIKKEIEDHNERIVSLFRNPQNWGKLSNEEITVFQTSQGRKGETMKFFLKIDEKDIIEKIRFFTDGCGCMVATGCQTTLLIKGKSIEFAEKLEIEDIDDALQGLPENEKHCAELARDTLRLAIKKYKKNKD